MVPTDFEFKIPILDIENIKTTQKWYNKFFFI